MFWCCTYHHWNVCPNKVGICGILTLLKDVERIRLYPQITLIHIYRSKSASESPWISRLKRWIRSELCCDSLKLEFYSLLAPAPTSVRSFTVRLFDHGSTESPPSDERYVNSSKPPLIRKCWLKRNTGFHYKMFALTFNQTVNITVSYIFQIQ